MLRNYLAAALRNLARASENARFIQHDTRYGPLISAQSRDGLDAARLLLPGLYELLARPLGRRMCALRPPSPRAPLSVNSAAISGTRGRTSTVAPGGTSRSTVATPSGSRARSLPGPSR